MLLNQFIININYSSSVNTYFSVVNSHIEGIFISVASNSVSCVFFLLLLMVGLFDGFEVGLDTGCVVAQFKSTLEVRFCLLIFIDGCFAFSSLFDMLGVFDMFGELDNDS